MTEVSKEIPAEYQLEFARALEKIVRMIRTNNRNVKSQDVLTGSENAIEMIKLYSQNYACGDKRHPFREIAEPRRVHADAPVGRRNFDLPSPVKSIGEFEAIPANSQESLEQRKERLRLLRESVKGTELISANREYQPEEDPEEEYSSLSAGSRGILEKPAPSRSKTVSSKTPAPRKKREVKDRIVPFREKTQTTAPKSPEVILEPKPEPVPEPKLEPVPEPASKPKSSLRPELYQRRTIRDDVLDLYASGLLVKAISIKVQRTLPQIYNIIQKGKDRGDKRAFGTVENAIGVGTSGSISEVHKNKRETRKNRVLDMWSQGSFTSNISTEVGIPQREVAAIVETAREKGDPRAATRLSESTGGVQVSTIAKGIQKVSKDLEFRKARTG